MYLVMKIKHHLAFILQKKLLKNMFIYYYYQILHLLLLSNTKNSHCILIKDLDRFMTKKQSTTVKIYL